MLVIGIVLALLGLTLPAVWKAQRSAGLSAARLDLQSIGAAIEAYKQDFRDYPRAPYQPETNGNRTNDFRHILAASLIGPGPATGRGADGADGPGFRVPGSGQLYAYLSPDRYKITVTVDVSKSPPWDYQAYILDRWDKPVAYYPTTPRGDARLRITDRADALFWTVQNMGGLSGTYMRGVVGDDDNSNAVDGTETVLFHLPFFLGSSGPDKAFSAASGSGLVRQVRAGDDVWNFE